MMPVAPSPQRVALNSSGRSVRLHRTSAVPDARGHTRVSASTLAESTGKWSPVPCVAVEMTPATVWFEMEPRLHMPSGGSCAASASFTVETYVPPSTVTSQRSASTWTIPWSSSVRRLQPSEKGRSLGLCTRPSARSGTGSEETPPPRRASSTMAITCSTVDGA